MESKMQKIMSTIKGMSYYKNHAAASGKVHNVAKHEDATEDILAHHGLNKSKLEKITKEKRDKWLKTRKTDEMENNTYICQPCGKQNSPDFIVKINNKLHFLECKSVKGGSPMYNSGVPKAGYIYILCSEKHNETTLYLGEDVLPREEERLIQEHIQDQRQKDEELNMLLGRSNSHGISYYTRPMIQHKGGKAKTDYFTHPKRKGLESNVLEVCR